MIASVWIGPEDPQIFACPSGYVIAGDDVKAFGKRWSCSLHRLARLLLLVGRHIRRGVDNVGSSPLKKRLYHWAKRPITGCNLGGEL
jgi:hypothetical protein